MAGLTDDIEKIIRKMIDEGNGSIFLGRNELAGRLHCVPSQINYVLSTRFSMEQGYVVESKRGGGGGIRIMRVARTTNSDYLRRMYEMVDADLTAHRAEVLLKELAYSGYLSGREVLLLSNSLSEKSLKNLDSSQRLKTRSEVMKNILNTLMTQHINR